MIELKAKIKVLLVEDSEDDAFFFERALTQTEAACELMHLLDGGAAIDYLQNARAAQALPDLIFLDLKMPVRNGFEVLKWIAGQNFQPALNVTVLSGSGHEADLTLAKQLGALGYVVKPISSEELKKRVQAAQAGHAEAKAARGEENRFRKAQ